MKRNPSLSQITLPNELEYDVSKSSALVDVKTHQSSITSLTFCLEFAETQLGETIKVVGADPALGSWDPAAGLSLTTTAESYPKWTGKASLVVSSSVPTGHGQGTPCFGFVGAFHLEYKYVRDCQSLGAGFKWENGPNRVLEIPFSKDCAEWLVRDPAFDEPGKGVPESVKATATFESSFHIMDSKPLEKGTFGAVWRCCPKGNGDHIEMAVKRIDKTKLQDRDKRNLFGGPGREGEIALHQQQQHPNIVKVLDFFDDQQTVSLILELCHGGDLFSCILKNRARKDGGLAQSIVARVARHILAGIAFLHESQIAHRDVKCENVLLDSQAASLERTTYKLCDFGFATRVPPSGVLHTLLGSPQTVAPEVLRRKPYSLPSDMWSMGVLLYIAMSAREPFFADNMAEVVRKVIVGTYSMTGGVWNDTTESTKSVISGLMHVQPESRLTAAKALESPCLTNEPSCLPWC